MIYRKTTAAALTALLLAASPLLASLTVLETGHVDLDFNVIGGAWQIGLHHQTQGSFAPGEAILHARDEPFGEGGSRASRTAGSQWNFIGVDEGDPFYLFPQNNQPGVLWPGMAAEDTQSNTLALYPESDPRASTTPAPWISIQVMHIAYYGDGDGHFSLWSSGSLGETTVWMSSVNELSADDRFLFLSGGHTHMNWGFSDLGYYGITFQASAFLNDGNMTPIVSDPVTFHFGIGTTVIPEPSTYALLLLSACGLAAWCRRRRLNRS